MPSRNVFQTGVIAILVGVVLISCDREEDDFIDHPSESSIIIEGRIATPEGTPIANVAVGVDFKWSSITGSLIRHKATGKTDKNGMYRIFFDVGDDKIEEFGAGYKFKVDFTGLSDKTYLIPFADSRLDLVMYPKGKEGTATRCDISVPMRKDIKVSIRNNGLQPTDGKYAVKNSFPYVSGWPDWLLDRDGNSGRVSQFTSVEVPENGTTTVNVPCGIGVKNTIQLVYTGDDKISYSGLPSSTVVELDIPGSVDEEVVLEYKVPEIF